MKKRKGNLLQRMMALLLSAGLIFCGAGVTPVSVFAQESVSENTADVIEEENEAVSGGNETEEETDLGEAEEDPSEGETKPEDTGETPIEEEDGSPESTKPVEGEEESEAADQTEAEPEEVSEPKTAARAADASEQAETSGEGWSLDADGKLTFTSADGMKDWNTVRTTYCAEVKAAEIQAGVTSIEARTFEACSKLTEVKIPDSVTEIGDSTFYNCSGLTEITIPSGVTKIGTRAFRGCSKLTEITIPSGVTEIGDSTFYNCSGLTEITIPSGVTKIGMSAFYNCSGLTKITIPADATEIGRLAFKGTALEEITIPDGVTTITDNLFSDCHNLKVVGIPDSVTSIGGYSFSGCSSLESITIPDSVTSIGWYSFTGCSSLKQITIPDGVTTIEKATFKDCSSLEQITIPDGVTIIAEEAFKDCSSLTEIEIPSKLTTIMGSLFSGCSSLEQITIPSGVSQINDAAFSGCSSLANVTVLRDTPPGLSADVFNGCKFVTDNTKGIKVPEGKANTYKEKWSKWAAYIAGDNIASGTGWVLDGDGNLTIESDEGMTDWCKEAYGKPYQQQVITAKLQDGVTSIGGLAFSGCRNMERITVPEGVTKIEGYAFNSCTALSGITLPESVKTIGNSAFDQCTGLETVTLSDNVESIGDAAFCNCYKLKEIKIPSKLTSIGKHTFSNCYELTEIQIPDGVVSIGENAFFSCRNLREITVPSGVTAIAPYTFQDCMSLKDVTLPDAVTDIGKGAFANCSSLENVAIPSSVTNIGDYAFEWCNSLENVTMRPANPPTIGYNVFANCKFVKDGTKGIEVPAGTMDAYKTTWLEWKDYIAETAGTDQTDAEKVKTAEEAVKAALADYEVTNATTKEDLQAAMEKAVKDALTAAGIDGSGVTVTVENFQKTEATTDAAGKITGTIKITSGAESAESALDKPIEKLPSTPAAQVAAVKDAIAAAVKEAVDKALAGTEITNDNAEEIAGRLAAEILPAVLPAAIEKAYADTGVSPDAVTVDTENMNITVDPAAGGSEGNIRISIPVASTADPGQTGTAEVQMAVKKPGGETDPDKDAEEAKKALEDALGKITVTNDTTEDDIRKAIEGALGDKGTVEGIEEFKKTDATEDTPGKLTLKIKVTINGKPVIIELTVTIEPLGKKTGVYVRFTDYDRLGEDSAPCYKYTGAAIKPAVEVYNNETLLTPGIDYTIGYKNNKNPGSTAALTVKGKGNFTGTSNVVNFTIINADIKEDTDHPTEMTVIAKTKVAPVIMHGTRKLTTKDYRLEGDGLAGGKYEVVTAEGTPNILTVTGTGSYAGSSFTIRVRVIDKKDAGKLAVTVDKTFKPVYDGTALNLSALLKKTAEGEGAITVTDAKDKTKLLTEGTDFTIACTSSLSDAGTVKFTVTGMGAYTGNVTKTFKISPLKVTDNSKFSVTFDEGKAYEYKAGGVTVDSLKVTYLGETDSAEDDKTLIQGVDYKVSYSNHKKVSGKNSAALKVAFLGNYKGSTAVSKPFQVVTAKLSAANTKVTVPDKVYTKANRGYKSTPIVTVDGVAIKASQYTVEYAWAAASEAGDDSKYVTDKNVKITLAEQDAYARVRVTVIPKETGSYALAEGAILTGEYYVRKADNATDLTRAKVTFHNKAGTQLKALEYNGTAFYTPAGNDPEAETAPEDANAVYVSVTVKGKLVAPELYEVEWTNATLKGKATAVIRGKGEATAKGMAVGSKNQSINIKAMALKGKTLKSFMENAANAVNSIRELFF